MKQDGPNWTLDQNLAVYLWEQCRKAKHIQNAQLRLFGIELITLRTFAVATSVRQIRKFILALCARLWGQWTTRKAVWATLGALPICHQPSLRALVLTDASQVCFVENESTLAFQTNPRAIWTLRATITAGLALSVQPSRWYLISSTWTRRICYAFTCRSDQHFGLVCARSTKAFVN